MKKKSVAVFLLIVGITFFWSCGSASSPVSPGVTVSAQTEGESTSMAGGIAQSFLFRRILCFGDSLTYGTTLRDPGGLSQLVPVEGYVPKLSALLIQEYGEGIQLINSGVGAEITSQGLQRLKGELSLYQPDLVLLLEGAVDIGNPSPRYVGVRRNLRRMMQEVLNRGKAVIIGTVPPFHPDGFQIVGLANVPTLNVIIREEATLLGVPVADHAKAFGDHPGLQGPDGVHPNDNGYVVMAETWFRQIQELHAESST